MQRIGIIGAGPNAAGHARYYAASQRARLVAVADPDTARAQALASETGCKAVADFRSFLADVDAVVVASPNFLHLEHAVAVAEAGKHLYCEKPMGLSLADADRIAAAVAKAKVASQVGFSPRNSGALRGIARRAQAGELGGLISVLSRRLGWMDPAKQVGWRKDPGKSGGLLMEINIHELDWMMMAGGAVEWVSARTWSRNPGHPRANDYVWVTLGFAGGHTGMHEGSWAAPAPAYFRGVQGTEGAATTDEWGSKLYLTKAGKDRVETPADPDFDLRGNWLDAIAGTAKAECDVTWGRQVMAVGEAVFTSAASNAPVRITGAAPC
jgi:predicted dehydrogenase